jgi:molybdopterin-guanine dinucleotide biosynthesis protein A
LPFPELTDAVPGGAGPLAGLLTGLQWAADGGFAWLVSAACDLPFLPPDLVARLREAVVGKQLALASSHNRLHHVVGLWPVAAGMALRRRMTEDGLREVGAWAASYRGGLAVWPSTPYDPFHNINRPEDLVAAERILQEFKP